MLPGAERAALDRRVRATDRLTRQGAEHKKRIKDLARQLLPLSPLRGDLGGADLAALERYADPRALARAGQAELTAVIAQAPDNHLGAARACQWLDAARASLQLYGGHPAADFAGLAVEVATEIRLLRAICAELAIHAAERESRYRQVDPAGLARSLPGLAEVGGPALAARKQDPQLACTYYQQMTERGKDHLGALCVVAASLAERAWTVMRRGTPYVICDTDGRPVTPAQPRPSSPGAGPCHPKSAPGGAARRRGRPPAKSPEGNTHGAASPSTPLHPVTRSPSNQTLDSGSSVGNQSR